MGHARDNGVSTNLRHQRDQGVHSFCVTRELVTARASALGDRIDGKSVRLFAIMGRTIRTTGHIKPRPTDKRYDERNVTEALQCARP